MWPYNKRIKQTGSSPSGGRAGGLYAGRYKAVTHFLHIIYYFKIG